MNKRNKAMFNKDKKIKSLNELKKYCKNTEQELYVLLKFGLRSSKNITYNSKDKSWTMYNGIDNTYSDYKNDNELKEVYPLFIKAIKEGCLIKY